MVIPNFSVWTLLSEAVPAGSNFLPVMSSMGFILGRQVKIDPGTPSEELSSIKAFGSLLLAVPLKFAHAAGANITMVDAPPPLPPPPNITMPAMRPTECYPCSAQDVVAGGAPCIDLFDENYPNAFAKAMDSLKVVYPFREHKDINFDLLKTAYLVEFQKAEAAKATDPWGAYKTYTTLIRHVMSQIPDGHLFLKQEAPCEAFAGNATVAKGVVANITRERVGGSYGFIVSPLDNGNVIVSYVEPYSPAAKAGIKTEWILRQVDGQDVEDWVNAQDWDYIDGWNYAVKANLRIQKYRLVTRGAIGTHRSFSFQRNLEGAGFSLSAEDDNYKLWRLSGNRNIPREPVLDSNQPLGVHFSLDTRWNAKGYGYIGVPMVLWKSGAMMGAIKQLVHEGVKGLILDVRGNEGGINKQVADLQGMINQDESAQAMFYAEHCAKGRELLSMCTLVPPEMWETFSTEVCHCNFKAKCEAWKLRPDIWDCAPPFEAYEKMLISKLNEEVTFTGPIVTIVNSQSISAAEGIAMITHKLSEQNPPRGAVVGFTGTMGSFGLTGGKLYFPGGIMLEFPYAASMTQNEKIQLDSNADGIGGVYPTDPVPRTVNTMTRFYQVPDTYIHGDGQYDHADTLVNHIGIDDGTDVEYAYAERVLAGLLESFPQAEAMLLKPVMAGASALPIGDTNPFSIGSEIVIAGGTHREETNEVVNFGSLILKNPLQYSHAAGASVGVLSHPTTTFLPATTTTPENLLDWVMWPVTAVAGAVGVGVGAAAAGAAAADTIPVAPTPLQVPVLDPYVAPRKCDQDVGLQTYGPNGCVSVWREAQFGHCIMATNCDAASISNYEFGFVCVDPHCMPVKHTFGTDSFTAHETFDTQIGCTQCLGLEHLPPLIHVAGEVATAEKDVGELKNEVQETNTAVETLKRNLNVGGPPQHRSAYTYQSGPPDFSMTALRAKKHHPHHEQASKLIWKNNGS
jgi:carboxyl-terminal processing protease